MSLCLAVWCPEGRANLSFAARLATEQLPAELVVWRSDEQAPAVPVGVTVDLWLVFCVGAPPVPPVWREAAAGRWLVCPGTTESWDESTRSAVEAWGEVTLLIDRLWEESENPVLRDWWTSRSLVWLPAVGRRGSMVARRRELLIVCSAGLPDWLGGPGVAAMAEAFGARVIGGANDRRGPAAVLAEVATTAERVLLCSTDPVFSGAVLRLAAECGVGVAVLGVPGSAARLVMFGLRPVKGLALPVGGEPIAPALRALVPALRSALPVRAVGLPGFRWQDWAQGLVEPAAPGVGWGGEIAEHVRTNAARRTDARFVALAALAERVVPAVPLSSRLQFALEAICFEELSRCVPGPDWFDLGARLAEMVPGWTEAAIRWATEKGEGAVGQLLWVAGCDGYCFEATRGLAGKVAEIFAAAQCLRPTEARWVAERAVVLGATGAFAGAETDLAWLRQHDSQQLAPVFLGILRAWIPGLECGEPGVVPAGGTEWWRQELDACLAAGVSGAGAVRAYGELWMGSPEEAERLLGLSAPTILEASSFVIVAALNRAPEAAGRCWSAFAMQAVPDSPGLRLTVLCARALCEQPQPGIKNELDKLNAEAGDLFVRGWPSHPRCFFNALIYDRCGDAVGAAAWRERAERQDPLARHRRWCYQTR